MRLRNQTRGVAHAKFAWAAIASVGLTRFLGVILFAAFATFAVFAQEANKNQFAVKPVPSWVTSVRADEWAKDSLNNGSQEGEHYILVDQQENAVTEEAFFHVIKEITSENGVQNGSKVQFQFEPAFQALSIHYVRILRDGKVLDRLEPQKIKVIQQEPGLERHLFKGELSSVLFLEDVRIGDVIEYACTVTGENPIMNGHFVSSFLAQWSAPVDRLSFRLLWPAQKALHIKNHKTNLQPEIRALGELREYTWTSDNVPASVYEDQVPLFVESFSWVQLSDFANWNEVAQWAAPFYQHNPGELPSELRDKIAAWQYQATPEMKVARALRFVQDEVRYLGIEIGPNSHQPNPPELVFKRRFGDCKDKVNLFCSMLDEMGIEAHPVLVQAYFHSAITNWTPSPYAFNHVVAQVRLDGEVLWLDPTLSYQRGPLSKLYFPNYGYGLVVAPETSDLTEIPQRTTGESLTTVYDTFHLFAYTNPASYEVRIIKRGADADALREVLSQTSREALQKSQLNYFARRYPKIKTSTPLEIRDDQEKNEIVIYENYTISDLWELLDRKWIFDMYAEQVFDFAQEPRTSLRTLPISVIYPMHHKQVTTVNFQGPAHFKPETIRYDDKAVRFERQTTFSASTLTVNYDFVSFTNMVSVADAPEYLATLRRIREKSFFEIVRPVVDASASQFQPNWPMMALTVVFAALMVPLMLLAYFFRPKDNAPPMIDSNPEVTGLGGWLILVGIVLVIRFFASLYFIGTILYFCSQQNWQTLTTPGTASYSAHWAPLVIFELLGNLGFAAFTVLLIVLFFQKRFAMRWYFIAFLVATVFFIFVDHAWVQMVKTTTKPIIPIAIGTSVWIWYFLVSRRVRFTFVR